MEKDTHLYKLTDLDKLRSAPELRKKQKEELLKEVENIICKVNWLTIGVMSPSLEKGINAIRKLEETFKYKEMKCMNLPTSNGPIFLKANQKTGTIQARVEFGLGEGILISCHYDDNRLDTRTIGPLPLDFFD